MLSGMKFTFRNLGPINRAELELGDFTIIAGRNNTGKTYMAYAMYGFLRNFNYWVTEYATSSGHMDHFFGDLGFESVRGLTDRLFQDGEVSWKINEDKLDQTKADLVHGAATFYSEVGLSRTFNAKEEFFGESSIDVDFSSFSSDLKSFGISSTPGFSFRISHSDDQFVASLARETVENYSKSFREHVESYFQRRYPVHLFGSVMDIDRSDLVEVLTSHRSSAALLIKQVDVLRSYGVRELQDSFGIKAGDLHAQDLLERLGRYALPIQHNFDLTRGMAEKLENKPAPYRKREFADLIDFLGGRFVSNNKTVEFAMDLSDGGQVDIPLHLVSASTLEFPLFYSILGYEDQTYHRDDILLIVDEPESHLDTANQIQFTRILARLANSGVKILITTHSDYIIREVNNLIMLSSPLEDENDAREKFGYRPSDQLRLDQVNAYVAEDGGLTPCRKDKYGIEITSLDEVIDNLNDASEELASQIMMKEAE